MHKTYLISAITILLILLNPIAGFTKANVKVLMTNEWIGKYKKLKSDLERKVARAKDMENLSEKNISDLRDSYARTSMMLENWLIQVVNSVGDSEPSQLEYLAKGDMSPELQNSFREILTFYADDFTTQYEEITGLRENFVVSLNSSGSDKNPDATILNQKFEKDDLMAGIRPLLPGDWNSIN